MNGVAALGVARQSLRTALFLGFLLGVALLAATLKATEVITRRPIDRAPWSRRCFRGATRCLGLTITWHGQPTGQPTMLVSNHVSWCDIPVIGGILPMTFLSKSEVGQWPLIGWLAKQAGTLFIKRGGGKAGSVANQLAERFEQGHSIMVFPEGTTSAGITVLPFHGRLMGAALRSGVAIQPVSIVYRRDGTLDHLAPFINDDDFLTHLSRLLREAPPRVDVLLHEPIRPTPDEALSDLAARLRSTVLEGVNALQTGALDASNAGEIERVTPVGNRRPLHRLWPRASR